MTKEYSSEDIEDNEVNEVNGPQVQYTASAWLMKWNFVYLCRLKNVTMEVVDTKNVIDLIRKTVLSVDPTARILLYGSRAKGTARQDSDWDIIVLVNDPDMNFDARSDISYDLWWKGLQIGEEINAFTYSTKQWETAPPSLFKFNVLKEHIEL